MQVNNTGTITFTQPITPNMAKEIIETIFDEDEECVWTHEQNGLVDKIELEDTSGNIEDCLQKLVAWCDAHDTTIENQSIIGYYGDYDGLLVYEKIYHEWRSYGNDEYNIKICSTAELANELFIRGVIDKTALDKIVQDDQ